MAWKRAPLPPDTWGYGAVVTYSDCGDVEIGFRFADFMGDHAMIQGASGGPPLRLEPNEVVLWDNSIHLPTQEEIDAALNRRSAGTVVGKEDWQLFHLNGRLLRNVGAVAVLVSLAKNGPATWTLDPGGTLRVPEARVYLRSYGPDDGSVITEA